VGVMAFLLFGFVTYKDTKTPFFLHTFRYTINLPTVKHNTKGALLLEEAAKINPNEFYEMITNPAKKPCFETARSIWK
jgi:hypothetical protein